MRRTLLAAVLVVLSAVAPPSAGSAAASPSAPGGVSVVPVDDSPYRSETGQFIELGTVRPGVVLSDQLLVRTSSDVPQDVVIYPVDAAPALGGGLGYSEREQTPTQVGAWLSLSEEQLTLQPQGTAKVRFELRVPAELEPGTYVGGVAAEPAAQAQSGAVGTRTRYAMPIRFVVPGGAPGVTPGRGRPDGTLVVTDVELRTDGDRVCPTVRYENQTQDVLDPIATVTVDGPLGGATSGRLAGVGPVGPGDAEQAELPCVERAVGPSRVEVALASPGGDARGAADSFWLPTPVWLGLLLLLILLLALGTTGVRGLRRRRATPVAPDRVDA